MCKARGEEPNPEYTAVLDGLRGGKSAVDLGFPANYHGNPNQYEVEYVYANPDDAPTGEAGDSSPAKPLDEAERGSGSPESTSTGAPSDAVKAEESEPDASDSLLMMGTAADIVKEAASAPATAAPDATVGGGVMTGQSFAAISKQEAAPAPAPVPAPSAPAAPVARAAADAPGMTHRRASRIRRACSAQRLFRHSWTVLHVLCRQHNIHLCHCRCPRNTTTTRAACSSPPQPP